MPRLSMLAIRGADALLPFADFARRALNEIPIVLYRPALHVATNDAYYEHERTYSDDAYQRSGLFDFERAAIDRYVPAPPARVLVHGAGSGREVLALGEGGYAVDAFEPVPAMVARANTLLADTAVRVERATLQEWGAGGGTDSYDAIVTGWGMWIHILHHDERIAALRAFRRACPAGTLLLSFLRMHPWTDATAPPPPPLPVHPEPNGRMERLTRGIMRRRLLRLPPIERGTDWIEGSYIHRVSEAELREEAALTGWRIAYYERDVDVYGHAALTPAAEHIAGDAVEGVRFRSGRD